MDRPNQSQNAEEAEVGPGTKRMMETKAPPTKIPNRMKFVLDNGLRKSLENYYKTSE